MKVDRPIFVMTLRAEPNVDPIKSLRAVLKVLLRGYGMKCLSVNQIEDRKEEETRFN
jgi:hypothetical protein